MSSNNRPPTIRRDYETIDTSFNSTNPYRQNSGMTPISTMPQYGPNLYERMMIQRQNLRQQEREYQQKILEERYPVKFVVANSIIIVLLSIAAFVIQIMMILNKSLVYSFGTGIWIGVILLVIAFLAVAISKFVLLFFRFNNLWNFLVKVRNTCLFRTTVCLHLIGFFGAGAGLALLNIYAYYWYTSLDYTYNFVMIGLGIAVSIPLLIYFIVMQYVVNGRCGNTNRQMYPDTFGMNNF